MYSFARITRSMCCCGSSSTSDAARTRPAGLLASASALAAIAEASAAIRSRRTRGFGLGHREHAIGLQGHESPRTACAVRRRDTAASNAAARGGARFRSPSRRDRNSVQPPANGGGAPGAHGVLSFSHHCSSAPKNPTSVGSETPSVCTTPSASSQSAARGSGRQNAEAAQRAFGRAVHQHGITIREARGERAQHAARNGQLTSDGREGAHGRPWRTPSGPGRPSRRQSFSLRKMTVPLVPPKPNELDSATSIFIWRAVLGTKSRSQPRIRVVEIDGRRRHAIADGEQREDRFHHAGRAEQMAGHRLGGADRDLARVIAEARLSSQSSRPGRRAAWRSRAR